MYLLTVDKRVQQRVNYSFALYNKFPSLLQGNCFEKIIENTYLRKLFNRRVYGRWMFKLFSRQYWPITDAMNYQYIYTQTRRPHVCVEEFTVSLITALTLVQFEWATHTKKSYGKY